ncbi:hypothetical protein EDD15DRAFT_2446472 [Pisolithus albus]|nr:hypothetical protein EDD15DRAFT_2446472 [Pisolithus albus]
MARRVTGAHVPLGSAGGRGGGSMGTRIDNKPLTFPASDRIVVPTMGPDRPGGRSITIHDLLAGIYAFFSRRTSRAQKWNASPFLGTARPITSTNHVGADTITAPSAFHASLHHLNKNYLRDSLSGKIDVPVIRTSGGAAVGQVKVPVVVWDEGYRMWLQERAICDA